MITAFVVIDALMERPGHRSDVRARVSDSEIVTIAVIVANSDRLYGSSHKDCYSIESTFTRNALQNKKTCTADAAQVGEQSNTPGHLKRLWFSTPGSTARLPRQRFADGQLLCRGRNAPRLSFPLRWCGLYRWNPVPAHTASGVSSNIRRLPVGLYGACTMPFPPTYGRPPSSRHLWEAPLAVQDHRSVCQRPVILFVPWGVGCMIAFMRHKSRGS